MSAITGEESLIMFPSRPSSPRDPVCFKGASALKTSAIIMGGIVGAGCTFLVSQNYLGTRKSFNFILSTNITSSVIVEK